MKTIRASEIGTYLFCRRAWWYQALGVPSKNQQELAGGSAFHLRHGRQVIRSGLFKIAGWVVLVAAVGFLAIHLALLWVGGSP